MENSPIISLNEFCINDLAILLYKGKIQLQDINEENRTEMIKRGLIDENGVLIRSQLKQTKNTITDDFRIRTLAMIIKYYGNTF